MTQVLLALGSNLGDREANLRQAIEALECGGLHVIRLSPIYETAPQGLTDQGWFLNMVIEAETSLDAFELLAHSERVEKSLGRERVARNGPRTIDIDILFFGTETIHDERLQIPHPRFAQRRFVLQPLADLRPEFRGMLSEVEDQPVRLYHA